MIRPLVGRAWPKPPRPGHLLLFICLPILLLSIVQSAAQGTGKFVPPAGRQLLIIGQDLGAIGSSHAPDNDGYCDHINLTPGGVTSYTSVTQLQGLDNPVNYGSGDVCARRILDNPRFAQSALVIGLDLVDQEKSIAAGKQDSQIRKLGEWIKQARRPVFLRVGFEFDGSWNHYDPVAYKMVFQKIVLIFRTMHVTNCATVWQAAASPFSANNHRDINDWYPGDEFVDWVGYSWFQSTPQKIQLTDNVLAFSRAHHKPVMVCESAPQGYNTKDLTLRDLVSGKNPKPKTPEDIWSEWYLPYFDYIQKNKDVVKAVAYINVNWDVQRLWGPPYKQGYWGDSRVEANPVIKAKWLETISQGNWMLSSPTLFSDLGYPDHENP